MTDAEIAELLAAVDRRVRRAMRQAQAYGVVTQTSPLRVRLNDDTADVPVDLQLVGVAVGETVGLIRLGRDWICLGGIDTPWTEMTPLLNGATPWTTGIGQAWTPRYRRRGGIVYLDGLIDTNSTSAIHVFTLPAGFRPVNGTVMRLVPVGGGNHRRMDIATSGALSFQEPHHGNTAVDTWHSVGCSFPIG